MSETVIEVNNITKSFSTDRSRGIASLLNNKSQKSRFNALSNVSFSVTKGEILGIIGLNGSGKTTLLQVIAGIHPPDSGNVKVRGNLIPIMNIGTGFRPELASRENIIMYGMLLGFPKKEIEKKVNSILEFAGLEKFSNMRLKDFSTGMRTRLGVSTIFEINPDILLLDEVLAVGDINFRQKCLKVFMSFKEKGKTILYTTHNLGVLPSFCNRVLLLQKGKIIMIGKPDEVIQKYKEINMANN